MGLFNNSNMLLGTEACGDGHGDMRNAGAAAPALVYSRVHPTATPVWAVTRVARASACVGCRVARRTTSTDRPRSPDARLAVRRVAVRPRCAVDARIHL